MALLVLITLGATLGWLASILGRNEAPRMILRMMGVGMVATIAVGLFVNSWTFLGGLSLTAFGAGFAGGAVALVVHHFVAREPEEI
uniref:hypothetical protein n=1 Tax=uncultured Erythrobacter sp. TaxID=263913 RepID=UPI00262805E4|nr:hypothetical protein [uncultured Erythrobacter sp.]